MQEKMSTSNPVFYVAILGGGITGLVAAYRLTKAGKKVVLFEKSLFFGGLAQGIYGDRWE